jgi:hypothetical protein
MIVEEVNSTSTAVEGNTHLPVTESSQTISQTSQSFLNNLIWKESTKGKFYLDKRECQPVESTSETEPEIICFDMDGFEIEKDNQNINSGDWVISELGKSEVSKIEENQVFLKLGEEEIPLPLENVRNKINLNFLILGKTKNHFIEGVPFSLKTEISEIKKLLSEYLNISADPIEISHKDKTLSNETILHTLEINENDTLLVSFLHKDEFIFKRSQSKDYSWYDQKNVIPFTVDKSILVYAFGFWRHTDSVLSSYDFTLYEEKADGSRVLITQLNNVKVMPSECDSNYVKRVPLPKEILLKGETKYKAYVYYKISDQRTYFAYSGSSEQTFEGVKFKFTDTVEDGHRCSSTSGHLPYIYFKHFNSWQA